MCSLLVPLGTCQSQHIIYHVNTQRAFAHFLSTCFPLAVFRLTGLSVLFFLIYFLLLVETDFLYQRLAYDSLSGFMMHKG